MSLLPQFKGSTETLPVNEIFGPVCQGEGPDIGKPCIFLRTHNCPVHCPGCDTYYTWDGSEPGGKKTFKEIADLMAPMVKDTYVGLVVSGGEPLLHYKSEVLDLVLTRFNWKWKGLETSGYIGNVYPDVDTLGKFLDKFTTVCLSPKITPCLHGRQSDEELERLIPKMKSLCVPDFKFVVKDQADIDAILACDDRHHFMGKLPVYIMPYGNDRDSILKEIEWLIPISAKYGFIITPRLQALCFGTERKR